MVQKDQHLGIYEYLVETDGASITKRNEIRVPYEGKIEILLNAGMISHSEKEPLGQIEEVCSHSVQLHGLCALCGKDLTIAHYVGSDTHRATINLTHDSRGVKISHKEATRIEKDNSERLLKSKKLSLLLDLDQTVVHATVDETIKEWHQNQDNLDFPELKDVYSFTLNDSPIIYYIRLRPGTQEFLSTLYEKYEMHIYTMGTRNYAHAVAKVLDPDRKYFKDRILSRDDSGSISF